MSRHGQAPAEAKQSFTPKSTHTSDAFLQDFLDPAFDPASYLNATLPPLAQKSGAQQAATAAAAAAGGGGKAAVPLAELSSQAQDFLLQLNTQTTRLSNTLTQLTDDILRSGSRLAYEVELLRGETLSLEETMAEKLQEEIALFVPGGLKGVVEGGSERHEGGEAEAGTSKEHVEGDDPAFIQQLRTLTLVRACLDSVIKVFGDAMEFVFPPSELSISSGFLSVSAPEPGSAQQSSEEKGHQVLKSLREEISNLLYKSEDPVQGIEKAAERVEALKDLATVWKGTSEEKGRNKFIEVLAKMVEDRHRDLLREAEQARKEAAATTGTKQEKTIVMRGAERPAATDDGRASPGGFGLISQLQKLRSGI